MEVDTARLPPQQTVLEPLGFAVHEDEAVGLERRNVRRLVGRIGHSERDVDQGLRREAGHGGAADVIDGYDEGAERGDDARPFGLERHRPLWVVRAHVDLHTRDRIHAPSSSEDARLTGDEWGNRAGMTATPTPLHDELADTAALVRDLNGDLELEFQSIVQYVNHVATITGPEYTSTVDELKIHLTQELHHAIVLAEQVSFLKGVPSCHVAPFEQAADSRGALQADLDLETTQLQRYRDRVEQATAVGLPDVAEALRPLLTETQEHVRDLQAALGQ